MDNKEMEKKELKVEELDKVAGGEYADGLDTCYILGCNNTRFGQFDFNGSHYEAYRCKKCGHEYFEKNGRRISPSEYYGALSELKKTY